MDYRVKGMKHSYSGPQDILFIFSAIFQRWPQCSSMSITTLIMNHKF